MWVTKPLLVPIDFLSMKKIYINGIKGFAKLQGCASIIVLHSSGL